MAAVKKWKCDYCLADAVKVTTRWKIQHAGRCLLKPNQVEDVGPVTSVNDPDNAYFVVEMPDSDS